MEKQTKEKHKLLICQRAPNWSRKGLRRKAPETKSGGDKIDGAKKVHNKIVAPKSRGPYDTIVNIVNKTPIFLLYKTCPSKKNFVPSGTRPA